MKPFLIVIATITTLLGCSNLKPTGLYGDSVEKPEAANINGFYQLDIYHDGLSKEVWFTDNKTCVDVTPSEKHYKGTGALRIKWNKQATGGCPWLGLGIGWDNWTGKDMSQLGKNAALSFWVLSLDGDLKGLPWAVGFEDYGGSQSWTGATADLVVGGTISTTTWTQMIIPLEKFRLTSSDLDPYTIKQLMFQFESSGDVLVDEIGIVELSR